MSQMTDHQRRVAQALDGNEAVYYHPFKDRVAVWYGGALISHYNSLTWEEVDVEHVTIGFKDAPEADVENAVSVSLTKQGYVHRAHATPDQ